MELPAAFTQETYEITKRITAQWTVHFGLRNLPLPSIPQRTLMAQYVNTCFFALRHRLDVKPPKGLPHMPRSVMQSILQHAAAVQYRAVRTPVHARFLPNPVFPTNWSPLVRQAIRRHDSLYRLSLDSQARRARMRAYKPPAIKPKSILSLPSVPIWGTAALAAATAFAMYTWKTTPDPKHLFKLPIDPGELYSLMIQSDFDYEVLPRLSGTYSAIDLGFTSGVRYSGAQSLYLQTHGDHPQALSRGNIYWYAPRPLLDRLTLTFAFTVSRWTEDTYIGFDLMIGLPHKTLHAFMAFGWDGSPGWWYCSLYTNDGVIPISAGLQLKIRDWGICRVDIELPLGLYTRAFFHSTDFRAANMLLKQMWNTERQNTFLRLSCGSRTKDSVRFFFDDVHLYNYGNLLPGYEMNQLVDAVRPWLDPGFPTPYDIPLPYETPKTPTPAQ